MLAGDSLSAGLPQTVLFYLLFDYLHSPLLLLLHCEKRVQHSTHTPPDNFPPPSQSNLSTMTSRSSSPSEQGETAYPNQMASSLAGLPVRPSQPSSGSSQAEGNSSQPGAIGAQKAKGSGQLKDFLDLAVSARKQSQLVGGSSLPLRDCSSQTTRGSSAADISSVSLLVSIQISSQRAENGTDHLI